MPWNGSGTFNRIFSWVADKAAGLDISSTRMDTDTNDLATTGFGNCLTRDGQGQPVANLPMAGFRHTGASNGVQRSDYASLGQVQDGVTDWTIAGGTPDAITVTYTPALTALSDGQLCFFRASAANATSTPTFAPNGLTAHPITRGGGFGLDVAGVDLSTGRQFFVSDIQGPLYEVVLRYNAANTRWEMLNPGNGTVVPATPTTGDIKLTLKTVADPGWLLFDDGTFGSATSGSSNSNSVDNRALFTLMFNNLSDTNAPIFTSGGGGTTRAGQGTAAAAWTANCRMSLPKTLGRALGVAGSGSGLTPRALGVAVGEENHVLTLGETPTGITSTGSATSISVTSTENVWKVANPAVNAVGNPGVPIGFASTTAPTVAPATSTGSGSASVTSNNTGGGGHNTMQPTSFQNAMVKQ